MLCSRISQHINQCVLSRRAYSAVTKFKSREEPHNLKYIYGAAGLVCVAIGGFYVNHLEKVPFTGRTRFITVSSKEEEKLGEQTYNKIMHLYNGKFLPSYHPYVLRVEQVGQRIVKASPLADKQWTYHVINSPEANCFVVPGNHVFVFTGTIFFIAVELKYTNY